MGQYPDEPDEPDEPEENLKKIKKTFEKIILLLYSIGVVINLYLWKEIYYDWFRHNIYMDYCNDNNYIFYTLVYWQIIGVTIKWLI